MALGDPEVVQPLLELEMVERNDNKLITFTDTSDWDNSNLNPLYISSGQLTLNITIQTTSGAPRAYAGIDLYDTFGPFTTAADMVFAVDPSRLVTDDEAAIPLGTSDTQFPDGVYTISYVYEYTPGESESMTRYVLVDGQVAVRVAELMCSIPPKYECGGPHEKQVQNIIYAEAYLRAMHASTTLVSVTYILKELETLEDILANGNSYTW